MANTYGPNNLEYQVKQYDTDFKALAEAFPSKLRMLIAKKTGCKGQTTTINRDGLGAEARVITAQATGGVPANYADLADKATPHMAGKQIVSQVGKYTVEWGYHFNDEDEYQTFFSDTGDRMTKGVKKIANKCDILVMRAMFAANVARLTDANTVTNVALPATQKRGGVATGALNYDYIADILAQFETDSGLDQQVMILISPKTKVQLLKDDRLSSADFINSVARTPLQNFKLPEMTDAVYCVHPQMPDDRIGFFQKDGLTWCEWSGIKTKLGEDSSEKFRMKAYAQEVGNAVRCDDKRVILVGVGIADPTAVNPAWAL